MLFVDGLCIEIHLLYLFATQPFNLKQLLPVIFTQTSNKNPLHHSSQIHFSGSYTCMLIHKMPVVLKSFAFGYVYYP